MCPRQTAQIYEPPQGVKASLEFLILCCTDEEKLGGRKELLFLNWYGPIRES